ncbi:hypothetical protein [Catellatospora sp. NPDC049609]|uniref:hypothetical protein n=1 Tax=Catellatospora sp. NPDC049609 TaxID=3155505 RepID=UPI0034441104
MTTSPRPATTETTGRTSTRLQFALAAAYFLALGIALARAAHFSGRLYLPEMGDGHTGNVEVWPGGWLPVARLATFTMLFAPFIAAVAALDAAVRLTSPLIRAARGRWWALLASTVLSVLVVVVAVLPPGRQTLTWLLD